ncbi:MAG: amidohydrolase family protein [Desulfovibrionaceae bacterium]
MFIDIHTHAFHPKIAARAVEHLNAAYHLTCQGAGTADDLLDRAGRAGLDACVVLCAATSAAQVEPANNYAIRLGQEHAGRVIPFGTIHPDYTAWEQELERLRRAGIRGIKLHPDFQHFWLDDRRLLPIFEAAQEDFLFEIHIGDARPPRENPSCPYKMAAILRQFPRLQVICAHLGGYHQWRASMDALVGRPVWLDTSSSTPFLPPEMLRTILRRHPQEFLLFGSDYPLYDPGEELERLQRKGRLDDATLDLYRSNAEKILPHR